MLFFLMRPLYLVVVVALLLRAGMHAQQLVEDGVAPWTAAGIEAIGERMRADLDRVVQIGG